MNPPRGCLPAVVSLLCLSMLPLSAAAQTGLFDAPRDFTVGASPFSVAVGDFNADGRPDLAVANYGSNDVSVSLGNGAGAFRAPVSFAAGTNPYSVAAGAFYRHTGPELAGGDSASR